MTVTVDDVLRSLQGLDSPFDLLYGLHVETVTADEVTATLQVERKHLHPWGAVHGGVYCSMIETLATIGAQVSAMPAGRLASGIENHTSFVRQVRDGTLRARGRPIQRGRQLHLWEVTITDEGERVVAHGSVRLMLLEVPPS